jgi:hypothetical protein
VPSDISNLPWGQLVPVDGPVFSKDDPGDNHPLFGRNQTVVIRLWADRSMVLRLLDPKNSDLPYQKGADISLIASAAAYTTHVENASFKLGGHFTKRLAKKGWLLKADRESAFFPEISKLKLKTGATDASYLNSLIGTDVFRAMAVPVPRATTAQLFINGIAQGFYILYESIDTAFLASRFGGDGTNNFYSGGGGTLEYHGSSKADYEKLGYAQESGSGDWSDFLLLVTRLNASDLTPQQLTQIFDVDGFLRHLAVEALFAFGDGFTCRGSNYYLYNNGTVEEPFFVLIPHDFDDSMGTKAGLNVTQWASVNLKDWGKAGVCNDRDAYLTLRVLSFPKFHQLYVSYLQLLLDKLFVAPLLSRVETFFRNVHPSFLYQDRWYQLDSGGLDSNFFTSYRQHFEVYFKTRFETAQSQLLI